ncbi:MAG TPA: metallophosphoesterase [Pyrinomonadaceae bacterium]|nr:metallophosphoesterase [Pyrinomonadaceae bacterium]
MQPESRRKLSARWQEITDSPNPLRTLAENVSEVASEALAASNRLTVEHQIIESGRLPRAFHGLRVVQLSDIHHSPFIKREYVCRSIEIANELQPDLIVLTGDYVSHETEYIAPVAEMLGELKAKHGVYAVLGNHDHWTDADLIADLLRAEGIRVLINEGFRFAFEGSSVWFCGVDDITVGLADLDLALAGAREDEFKFLLCHNPAILRRAQKAAVDLVVSGHTHGGQVRIRPTDEGLILPRNRRASGLLAKGETQIYISRGIGTVVLPFRYQCPPEISLLELRSGAN